ncbi:SDR family oxidoreductase [Puteibacter caeruleilacunae]|nr:SDR family oxidoreductase [Puteibacter caeruleilacunae]
MNDLFSIKGKKGIITGASGGIGSTLAKALAARGAMLGLVDMSVDKSEELAKALEQEHGVKVVAYQCDVTNPESVNKMMDSFIADFGKIDFGINNAGIANIEKAIDISYDDFKKVIDVNLNGVFLTAQAQAKAMMKQESGGSIINTASMSAQVINIPQTIANYCASKAGVKHLTKALAVEWAESNIRVNSVSPGYIATELVAEMKSYHEGWTSKIPMGRLGKPEDLEGLFIYLISDSSSYMTGSDLIIDGGYTSL